MSASSLIRQERPEDYERISDILDAAFGGSDESRLVSELRRDPDFVPELAMVHCNERDEAIATIYFSLLGLDNHGERDLLALAPMAVDPGNQQNGVGTKLVKAGLDKARDLGYRGIIVLGHTKYYPKFGFEPASNWDIRCPIPVDDDRFMGLELQAGGFSTLSGTVRYAACFGI